MCLYVGHESVIPIGLGQCYFVPEYIPEFSRPGWEETDKQKMKFVRIPPVGFQKVRCGWGGGVANVAECPE